MSIVNQFEVFSDNDIKDLVNEIKLFYLTKNFLLFQTIDDSVYHYNLRYYELTKLESFRENAIIIKFVCSDDSSFPHFMALTDNGCVYSWGNNWYGQLGYGRYNDYCETPTLIGSLSEKFIIDICCGKWYSLVLTRNGDVFAFGFNSYGQCGNGNTRNQLKPVKINISSKVTAISCGCDHSIALTENDEVFGWGDNSNGQLGIENTKEQWIPLQLNVPKIKQISCGDMFTIMLSIDGDVYYCGNIDGCLSHNIPTQINSIRKFTKISATIHCDLCVALSEDNICFMIGSYRNVFTEFENIKEFENTKFTTIDETYARFAKITYESIKVSKFKTNFIEFLRPLGSGGFSSVFRCIKNLDRKSYAIKKISFERKDRDNVTKKLRILSTLQSDYVVKYIDSWIEHNYYLDSKRNQDLNSLLYEPNKTQLLHIQMEFCSLTLRDVINKIVNECLTSNNTLSLIGYYISSELLHEILECVHYLHSQNPAIIHRDLKPENILITNFGNNRFVKLTDFSTFHEFEKQSQTGNIGTRNYMALEIEANSKYDTKVDNYSLGVVIQQLFQLNAINQKRKALNTKMNYMLNLIIKLTDRNHINRPNCEQILQDKQNWLLTKEQLLKDKSFHEIINKTPKANSIENNFVEYFIQHKYPQTLNRYIAPQSSSQPLLFSSKIDETTPV